MAAARTRTRPCHSQALRIVSPLLSKRTRHVLFGPSRPHQEIWRASRTAPGPIGVYVVSVGYYADGIPGAVAGWVARVNHPAGLILLVPPLCRGLGPPP